MDAQWLGWDSGSLIVYLAKGKPEHVVIHNI